MGFEEGSGLSGRKGGDSRGRNVGNFSNGANQKKERGVLKKKGGILR